jgi:16S rRNA processing protein RimM
LAAPDADVPVGLLEVGRIGRPHGVRGELYLDLSTDRDERAAVGARLFAGRWLTVTASRLSAGRWLVHFEGVEDRTAAERLVNRTVYAEPLEDPDALWVHELIGSLVVDAAGVTLGTCASVVENPAHDLLELDSGGLIPVTFVVGFEPGRITVDLPDGLLDL